MIYLAPVFFLYNIVIYLHPLRKSIIRLTDTIVKAIKISLFNVSVEVKKSDMTLNFGQRYIKINFKRDN
ncbi:hypothetical protein CLV99_4470 [Sphingobacterium yanglingense]|uniref:Uncharacterized protein n=1 Tax=Sphingobacterium yanglingense TaxID=1437280 RepID=A0A4R6W4B2_9SPHI|nr:hypothetical protein CLV99_4470 [Sphingobacterium yanglingense]